MTTTQKLVKFKIKILLIMIMNTTNRDHISNLFSYYTS